MRIRLRHITRFFLPALALTIVIVGCRQKDGSVQVQEGSTYTGMQYNELLRSSLDATLKNPSVRYTYTASSNNSPAENGPADTASLRIAIESIIELNLDKALAQNRYIRQKDKSKIQQAPVSDKYVLQKGEKSAIKEIRETVVGDTAHLVILREEENQLFRFEKTYRVTLAKNKISSFSLEGEEKTILKEPFKWKYSLKVE